MFNPINTKYRERIAIRPLSPRGWGRLRRGSMFLEVTLALGILLAATVLLAQFAVSAGAQRRASEQRRIALEEVSNRMEHALAAAWEDVTSEKLEEQALDDELTNKLSLAELHASVSAEPGPPLAKRVRLQLSWVNAAGQRGKGVGLTAWKYRTTEATP